MNPAGKENSASAVFRKLSAIALGVVALAISYKVLGLYQVIVIMKDVLLSLLFAGGLFSVNILRKKKSAVLNHSGTWWRRFLEEYVELLVSVALLVIAISVPGFFEVIAILVWPILGLGFLVLFNFIYASMPTRSR